MKTKRRYTEMNKRMLDVFVRDGRTVTDLAKQISKSRSSVYGWLYYDIVPDSIGLAAFCEVMHVSADYILFG